MIIVGGIYLERCVAPASVSLLGSGGRAALALSGLASQLRLHAFYPAQDAHEVFPNFEAESVDLMLHPSEARIAFDYLYPLARPRISPIPLPSSGVVDIAGETVLRFGCLEGEFRVQAKTAIYDPQSAIAPVPFGANGSRAERLALVMNRAELFASTGIENLEQAVAVIRRRDRADVVVVKSGPAGAYVFVGDELPQHIPAFESRAVHKVGSGDVFSATFAHYWASIGLEPHEAARLASLHTADYVESRRLPLEAPPSVRPPAQTTNGRGVYLWSKPEGASGQWLHDEALDALGELAPGSKSAWSCAKSGEKVDERAFPVVLMVVPTLDAEAIAYAADARRHGQSVVVYYEKETNGEGSTLASIGCLIYTELASALYHASWA